VETELPFNKKGQRVGSSQSENQNIPRQIDENRGDLVDRIGRGDQYWAGADSSNEPDKASDNIAGSEGSGLKTVDFLSQPVDSQKGDKQGKGGQTADLFQIRQIGVKDNRPGGDINHHPEALPEKRSEQRSFF